MIIYRIRNKINNKIYIGQTKQSLHDRFIQHCNNAESVSAIAAAIIKYGKDNFIVEELAKADSQDELDMLEKLYIQTNNSLAPVGYNLKSGGLEGSQYTELSKKKMSNAKSGIRLNDEVKQKMSASHKRLHQNYPELKKQRGKIYSKKYKQDVNLQRRMSDIRKEYWSDPDVRQEASIAAKAKVTEELRQEISAAVKSALQKPEIQSKLNAHADTLKKRILRSDGEIFDSIKSAAAASNTYCSSIVRQIRGINHSAGGYTFKYLDESPRDKNIIYLVCGVSGSGKSWVCNQLKNVANYVSFDEIPKNQHLDELRRNKISLYDPTFKISTFIRRHGDEFDIRPVFIIESEKTIKDRLQSRGGIFSEKTINRMRAIDKRTIKYGIFSGTSQEVLDFLNFELQEPNISMSV